MKCASTGCAETCRACELMNDPKRASLDAGDFVVLGHVMAMASIGKRRPALGGLHLCPAHKQFAEGAMTHLRVSKTPSIVELN